MAKVLLWIAIVIAVMFGLRLLNIAKAKRASEGAGRDSPRRPEVESMVRCVHCGVYLPRADALPSAAGLTCGEPRCAKRPTRDS